MWVRSDTCCCVCLCYLQICGLSIVVVVLYDPGQKSVSSQWFGGTMVALWHGLSENWKSCHLVGWCILSNPTFERVCVAFALKTCYPESLVFSPCNVFMVMVIFTVIIIKIAMTIIILIFIFIIGTWFCSTCLNVIFWQPKKDHLGHLEDMGIALL